jgi:hypothetical protein
MNPLVRVRPPEQRLEAVEFARAEVELGLVVGEYPVLFERPLGKREH